MFAPRLSSASRLAVAAAVGALLVSSASYAKDRRYEQLFPQGSRGVHQGARAEYGRAYPSFTIPRDYVSSHVCINGYRWITRQLDFWESPARNAVPVRC